MDKNWSLARTLSGEFFSELFRSNVLLSARARQHSACGFKGPLSIKGVIHGEALWTLGRQKFPVDSNSCLVVARDEPYDLAIEAAEPVETFVVFFSDHLAADVADAQSRPIESLLDSPVAPVAPSFAVGRRLWTEGEPIHRMLKELRECALSTMEQGEVDRHLRFALDGMSRAAGQVDTEQNRIAAARAETRAELHRRVLLGKAHLDATIEASFDLGEAARIACLSPHHFHRTFRSALGRTPFGYVSERRIARAKRLLLEKDWDVVEISTALGYRSLPSFTRLFKKETGHSPGAYRTQFRNGG